MSGQKPAVSEDIIRQSERIEAAVRAAVRDALIQHKRAGNPNAVWEDIQVKWIASEDIVIPEWPDSDDGIPRPGMQ